MSRLNTLRDTGQLLPLQQMAPQMFAPPREDAHISPLGHALPEEHRQTGVVLLVSHHSPGPQHELPQHAPVVQRVQVASGPQLCAPP
jgi:hypothetical protein